MRIIAKRPPPLGQHFLRVGAARLIRAVGPRAGERFVEIGPGGGALTAPLLAAGAKVVAVEADKNLAAHLSHRFAAAVGDGMLEVVCADAVGFDYRARGDAPQDGNPHANDSHDGNSQSGDSQSGDLRIVGNIPYQISSPLIFALAKCADIVRDIHLMTQWEFARRLTAPPGAFRGRLSVAAQRIFSGEILFAVPPQSFAPPPKVESAFVRLLPQAADAPGGAFAPVCENTFDDVLRLAFQARRKTLANALAKTYGKIAAPPLDLSRRAQTLSVAEFVTLADYLAMRQR